MLKYGLIPEFVGRLPVVATLEDLDEPSLKLILTEPKNALVKQYQRLFEMESIDLTLAEEALGAIARKAIERKTGARGLRSIMEGILLDTMFDLPSLEGVEEVVISKEVVEGTARPLYIYADRSDRTAEVRQRQRLTSPRPAGREQLVESRRNGVLVVRSRFYRKNGPYLRTLGGHPTYSVEAKLRTKHRSFRLGEGSYLSESAPGCPIARRLLAHPYRHCPAMPHQRVDATGAQQKGPRPMTTKPRPHAATRRNPGLSRTAAARHRGVPAHDRSALRRP